MIDHGLFDSSFLKKLDRLALINRRRLAGHGKGERRSTRKGTSLEFIDYRRYSAGDDPRQVDWNLYGRSGNLFVKLFEDEEVLTAHLLLDVSRSMDWGQPNKLAYGRRLAGALGYIALSGLDRVVAATVSNGERPQSFGPAWGRRQIRAFFAFLADAKPGGQTDLGTALGRYVEMQPRPGLAILISDLLSPSAEPGIKRLLAHHYEVVVLHLVAPQEETPPAGEGLRLIDRETGHAVEVYLDQRAIDLYQQRFAEWCTALQHFCSRHDVLYQRLDSSMPLAQVLFGLFQSRGILR